MARPCFSPETLLRFWYRLHNTAQNKKAEDDDDRKPLFSSLFLLQKRYLSTKVCMYILAAAFRTNAFFVLLRWQLRSFLRPAHQQRTTEQKTTTNDEREEEEDSHAFSNRYSEVRKTPHAMLTNSKKDKYQKELKPSWKATVSPSSCITC